MWAKHKVQSGAHVRVLMWAKYEAQRWARIGCKCGLVYGVKVGPNRVQMWARIRRKGRPE